MDLKCSYILSGRKRVVLENEKELIPAMDLLSRNDTMPEKKFNLEFTINTYYTKSMVEQLPYAFDSEITRFKVIFEDSLIEYRFLKVNLIDRHEKQIPGR